MYHTCLYCTRDLGANQVLESLPIGRRVAFDSALGRLWVVCRGCEKWNLVPFDTRLETIDDCERLFRDAKLQFSTGNIGIARLREGLELVRIGTALRPEFAAWRYGDQFGRRRKRAILYGSAAGLAIGGLYVGGLAAGIGMGAISPFFNLFNMVYYNRVVAARLPLRDGIGGAMSRHDLTKGRIRALPDGGWELVLLLRPSTTGRYLRLRESPETVALRGDHAFEAMGHLLPALNRTGGSKQVVQNAVSLAEGATPDQLIRNATSKIWEPSPKERTRYLRALPAPSRLAIEMLSHEESERQALAGELKLLERQWREAEELAGIADSLTVPESSDDDLAALRERNG